MCVRVHVCVYYDGGTQTMFFSGKFNFLKMTFCYFWTKAVTELIDFGWNGFILAVELWYHLCIPIPIIFQMVVTFIFKSHQLFIQWLMTSPKMTNFICVQSGQKPFLCCRTRQHLSQFIQNYEGVIWSHDLTNTPSKAEEGDWSCRTNWKAKTWNHFWQLSSSPTDTEQNSWNSSLR